MSSEYVFADRHYVFQRHGRSRSRLPRNERRQQQRRSRQQRTIFQAQSPQQLTLPRIIDHENLLVAWQQLAREGGQAPGADGYTYAHLTETEAARVLQVPEQAILQRTYRPQPALQVTIPKPHGGTRILSLPTVIDRTIAKAVAGALTPLLDQEFAAAGCSFGFRPGLCHLDMLLAVERHMVEHDACVIATDDIEKAFDYVPITAALECYQQHVADEGLMWLVETILRGSEGPQQQIGIGQGNPLSPLTLNLLLHYRLDLPHLAALHREHSRAAGPATPPVLYCRYADDIATVGSTVLNAEATRQHTRDLLEPLGMRLKDQARSPVNLRRNRSKTQLLGFELRKNGERLSYSLAQEAWENLRLQLLHAHEAQDAAQDAAQVAQGWLVAVTPGVESVECEESVLERLLGIAASVGFRELDLEALCFSGRGARDRWQRKRRKALRGALPSADAGG